jgi:hypothetical protein
VEAVAEVSAAPLAHRHARVVFTRASSTMNTAPIIPTLCTRELTLERNGVRLDISLWQ